MTLKDKYSWDTIEKCDSLDPVDYLIEDIDWDVEALSWDDYRISDQTIDNFMSQCDGPAIGETLVKCFSANISMPDFIPVRLHKYFVKFVNEYLSQI